MGERNGNNYLHDDFSMGKGGESTSLNSSWFSMKKNETNFGNVKGDLPKLKTIMRRQTVWPRRL